MRRPASALLCLALTLPPAWCFAQTEGDAATPAPAAADASALVVETAAAVNLTPAPRAPETRDREDAPPESAEPSAAQLQARIHYDQSRAHYAAGHYRAAVRELEAAVTIDPSGANLWYNLGNVSERLGDLDRARVAYRRYLDHTRDPVELERTRRILTRLDGAHDELSAMTRRHGLADGLFWGVTGAAIGATGFGVAWLFSGRGNESTVAPWGFTAGGLSLGILATVLYFAREAPRGPSLLVDVSPAGRVGVTGRF